MRRGFSLVEVVIAVGIFTASVVVVLSLLPSLVGQSADAADRLVAQRLTDAIRIELDRQAIATGFDSLATAIPVMSAPLEHGWPLVVAANGLRIEPASSGGIANDDQYFLVEIWRFPQPPLSYDSASAVLPLYARISWPYRIPGFATATSPSDRKQLTVTLALNR
jgi:type II secretory pathway pseudopilin PulG